MNRTFQRLMFAGVLVSGSSLLSFMLSTGVAAAQTSRDEPTQRDEGVRGVEDKTQRDSGRGRRAGRPLGRPQEGQRSLETPTGGADGGRADGRTFEMMMRAIPVLNALDSNNDGQISAEEIRNATASLNKLDRNGDGKLTEQELRPGFTRRPGLSADGDRGPDTNGRDVASRDRGRRPGNPGENMLRMFQTRDQNQDGKLSGDEIPDQMRARLSQVDTDDDGSVSRQELQAMMRRMSGAGDRRPPRGRDGGERSQRPGGDLPRRPDSE